MADFTLKAGDTWPPIVATLSDANGPVDLTAADSVRFIMTGNGTKVAGACTVSTPASGRVAYVWVTGDTAVPGTYRAEFEVTWNVGEVETFPNDGFVSVAIVADLD